jgi:hypothetical protein
MTSGIMETMPLFILNVGVKIANKHHLSTISLNLAALEVLSLLDPMKVAILLGEELTNKSEIQNFPKIHPPHQSRTPLILITKKLTTKRNITWI